MADMLLYTILKIVRSDTSEYARRSYQLGRASIASCEYAPSYHLGIVRWGKKKSTFSPLISLSIALKQFWMGPSSSRLRSHRHSS